MSIDDLFKPAKALAEPGVGGAGDGSKADVINDWLSRVTGAYQEISGAGSAKGAAPDVRANDQKPNYLMWGGIVLGLGLVAWLLTRKP